MAILFKNVNTVEKKNIYVAVDGMYITHVGNDRPVGEFVREIDCKDKLMLPGLYNCHTHAAMTLFRGYGEDMPLMEWLNNRIFPAEDLLTDHAVYTASRFAIAEMLKNGIVSFSDMYFFCENTVRAAAEIGIKANISRSCVSFDPEIDMSRDSRFAESKKLFCDWNGAADGRILIDMALHAEYTNVEKACRAIAEYTSDVGTRLHIHMSETENEHNECMERHNGMTPAEFFDFCGCFDVPVIAAHCVWVSDSDIALMRRKNVTAVHNPVSNLKLGSGVMPLRKMLDAGVNTALGTDGAASNNTLDILKEMYVASILQKGISRDPAGVKATSIIAMATENGAKAQGRDDCGSIEVGKKADIILVSLDEFNNIPYYDLVYTAVYSASASNVVMTMVDGNVLYENGEFTTIDAEKLKYDMRCECGGYFQNKK